jgi:hypothetical protein
MTAKVPWNNTIGIYDSEKPPEEPFEVDGVKFQVKYNGEESIHTGRDRFEVKCLTCGKVVHPNTNGPKHWVYAHLKDSHNFQGELKYQDQD